MFACTFWTLDQRALSFGDSCLLAGRRADGTPWVASRAEEAGRGLWGQAAGPEPGKGEDHDSEGGEGKGEPWTSAAAGQPAAAGSLLLLCYWLSSRGNCRIGTGFNWLSFTSLLINHDEKHQNSSETNKIERHHLILVMFCKMVRKNQILSWNAQQRHCQAYRKRTVHKTPQK